MYPVMLSLRGRRCLVVGGGGVALRKVQGLLEEGARVTVVAPEVADALALLAAQDRIALERRRYRDGEAGGYALVFAATDDREANRRVFRDADAAGVWVNVADDPELCSFHLPARVRRGALQIAIASGGEAPFVVRRLRQHLERRMGTEWAEWIEAATRFRDEVRTAVEDPDAREACFERFFRETVRPDRLAARVPTEAEEREWLGEKPSRSGGRTRSAVHHDRPLRALGQDRSGFVSLVGAGPGCAGLLTLRGLRRLLEADTVVYDRLAAPALPCDLPMSVELHGVGKEAGNHPIPQEEINALLVRLAREGKRVVRLKGGDPYVFGRGGEEAEALHAEGIPFEVVPGVTSGIAAPAWLGVPVTHRREAVRLTLVTAHESKKDDGTQVRWDLMAADPHATIVGYMGVSALPSVVRQLIEGGMDPQTLTIDARGDGGARHHGGAAVHDEHAGRPSGGGGARRDRPTRAVRHRTDRRARIPSRLDRPASAGGTAAGRSRRGGCAGRRAGERRSRGRPGADPDDAGRADRAGGRSAERMRGAVGGRRRRPGLPPAPRPHLQSPGR